MGVYNTAYKSGTIGSFSGTTVTASGFTPAAGDVGRILILNSGNGKFQHREITAVSGQDITIAHAWNTNPFIDPSSNGRATDVNPSNGDTIAVSYNLADLIAGDAQLTLTDENHVLVSGTFEASNGAYIHAKNFHIEWNSNEIDIGRDGGMIFGYYGYVAGEDGYTKDSCDIVDNLDSWNGNSIRKGTADFGLFDVYGGSYSSSQATGCFIRGYENAFEPTLGQVRMIDMTQNGNVGGRYDGNRSMLIVRGVKGRTTVGIANPTSEVARVELSATDCDQAGYGNMQFAPSGAFVFPQLRDVAVKSIRFSGIGSTVGVYTAIAKKSELDLINPFAEVGNNSPNTTLRYGNLVRPTFIDSAGASLTGTLVTRLYDDTNTLVNSEDVTGGAYTEFFARHTDISLATAGNKNLSDGTLYAPYTLRGIQYGKQFGLTNISVEDTFNPALVYLDDTSITELTQATVDAYTELETPQKFYDRAVSWLESNITDEQAFLVSRSGDLIDTGSYDVDIDATAGSAFAFNGSKITIKASTFTGSITTTGTIALLNGAVNIGTLTDTGGATTTLQYSITGLVNNSRVQLYNTSTMTEIYNAVNGVTVDGTYTEGVEFSEGDTVRLRATNVIGLVGYKEYEATAVAGATGFSFLVTQTLDPVYNSLAIDGSTITNFSADYVNDEVDIIVGSDFLLSEFYAWWEHIEYSEEGIRAFFGGLTGVDEANFNIHNAVIDIKLDNTTATNVAQLDNRRLYRDDLTRPVANPTTGGGGIDVEWRSPVLLANSDTIEADLTTVLTNTNRVDGLIEDVSGDQFTTKALSQASGGGSSDVNIVSVNGVATTGVDDFKATSVVASNMRGTDGANTVAPDNAGITANGNAISALNNFDPASEQVIVATNNDKTDYALLDADKDVIVDKVWDEPLTGATHNDPTSAGRRLRQASAWLSAEGQAIGAPTTTSVQTDLTQTTSSFYADQTFVFTSGTLAGQARLVTSYNGTTKTFTFDEPWILTPSATDEFAVFADHVHPISQIQAGLAIETKQDAIQTDISTQTADLKGGDDRDLTEVYDKAGPADLSDVATRDNQNVINENVKKSSLIIPASDNLPDA